MTDTEWATWVEYHGFIFGMTSAADAALFERWRKILGCFYVGELQEASRYVAEHVAGSATSKSVSRTEQLGLIRQRIAAQRYASVKAQNADYDHAADAMRCRECSGTGLVSVPHPGAIIDGMWQHPYQTLVVACMCNAGSAKYNRTNAVMAGKPGSIRMIDLQHYEASHSDWRHLVADREQIRKIERDTEWRASDADLASPISADHVREMLEKLANSLVRESEHQ